LLLGEVVLEDQHDHADERREQRERTRADIERDR
jgi:hypothetical protein